MFCWQEIFRSNMYQGPEKHSHMTRENMTKESAEQTLVDLDEVLKFSIINY